MTSSAANPANSVYDDFEPTFVWANEDRADTLLLFLPGFTQQQIKVQITSTGNLMVTGERQVGKYRWSRFRMEMPIKPNHDTNKITAYYENGILFLKHPQTIASVPAEARKEAKPIVVSSQPPKATTPAAPRETTPASPKEQKQKEMTEPPKSHKTPLNKLDEGEKPKEKTLEIKEAATDMKPRNEGENAEAAADKKKMKDVNAVDKKKPDVGNFTKANLPQKVETSTTRDNTERRRDKKPNGSGDGAQKEELAPHYPSLSQIPKPTNYKQAIGDFVVNLKKPRNLITTVAAVVLVVVIGLSVKTAIKSFGKPQSSRPENTEL